MLIKFNPDMKIYVKYVNGLNNLIYDVGVMVVVFLRFFTFDFLLEQDVKPYCIPQFVAILIAGLPHLEDTWVEPCFICCT